MAIDWFSFWQVIKIALGVAIGLLVVWILIRDQIPSYADWQAERSHKKKKRQLARGQVLDEMEVTASQAMRNSLSFLNASDVTAGTLLEQIPGFGENMLGLMMIRTNNRILIYPRQDPDGRIMDLIELEGGWFLLMTGKNTMLLQQRMLTAREEKQLEDERQQAVDKGDAAIPSLFGFSWTIKGAFGENKMWQTGARKCSYMECLSDDTALDSILPDSLLDGEEHDYYDVIALNDDPAVKEKKGGSEVLYGFYVRGEWICLMGRTLTPSESDMIKVMTRTT